MKIKHIRGILTTRIHEPRLLIEFQREREGEKKKRIERAEIGSLRFSMQILAVVTGRYRFNWFSVRSPGPIVQLIGPIQTELAEVNPFE